MSSIPNTGVAALVWSGPKHVPRLTPGKLSPEILSLWNNAVQHYFRHKEVAETKKVLSVAGGFDDPLIQHWFNNDITLMDLSFTNFLVIFKDRWLRKNWADDILTKLIRSHQDDKEPFEDWVVSLEWINLLLEGTPGFYDDVRLCHHISANAVRELQLATSKADILRIADYKEWKKSLAEVDTRRLEDRAMRVRDFEKIMNNRS